MASTRHWFPSKKYFTCLVLFGRFYSNPRLDSTNHKDTKNLEAPKIMPCVFCGLEILESNSLRDKIDVIIAVQLPGGFYGVNTSIKKTFLLLIVIPLSAYGVQ